PVNVAGGANVKNINFTFPANVQYHAYWNYIADVASESELPPDWNKPLFDPFQTNKNCCPNDSQRISSA
ncbi:MAG: hypothetical protein MUP22_11300, partial [Desulfobacterales bacterium]|nr:hypothetical protein [Desulfobacterales bacterium]